jgi:NTE family protein
VAPASLRPDGDRRALLRSVLAAAGGLAAGAGAAHAHGTPPAPTRAARAAVTPPARRLALALGSGALHGHAHIGVMRAFEARGVRPDLIVGTSVGAIVGALWAAGLDAAAVERASERFGLTDAAQLTWPRRELLRNDGLQDLLREWLPTRTIEAWPIPFAAVATDLDRGERVILDRGDAPSAVAASACMPVLFEPVERDGRRLVDGALVEPVPVRAARALGSVRVVAVDVAFRPHDEPVRHVVDAGFQIVHILTNALIAEQVVDADVRIRLELHRLMRDRGDYAGVLLQAGERAALQAWPRIVE